MSSAPTAVLTSTKTEHKFNATPKTVKTIGTSGNMGANAGRIIKVQHRVRDTDDWVDNPNHTFVIGEHLALRLIVVAEFNRIVFENPDGDTNVAVRLN